MLTKTEKIFSSLFLIIIIIAEHFCRTLEVLSDLRFVTKPAIVISLIYFCMESSSLTTSIRILTLLVLAFSLLEDNLLLFADRSPNYFMFGLIAFLVTHIMYILNFLKHRNQSKTPLIFLGVLLVYAFIFFYVLKNGLGKMIIPVLIYIIAILTMTTMAFLRVGKVSKISY